MKGQRNANAKLIRAEVEEIRRSPLPQAFLARKYRVSQKAISDIVNGKKWQCTSK